MLLTAPPGGGCRRALSLATALCLPTMGPELCTAQGIGKVGREFSRPVVMQELARIDPSILSTDEVKKLKKLRRAIRNRESATASRCVGHLGRESVHHASPYRPLAPSKNTHTHRIALIEHALTAHTALSRLLEPLAGVARRLLRESCCHVASVHGAGTRER